MTSATRRDGRTSAFLLLAVLTILILVGPACRQSEEKLAPETSTWAELRTVRRGVQIKPPGARERDPHPRERLADGAEVKLAAGALVWLRLDAGATLLVRGPADLTQRQEKVEVRRGRVFVDVPPGIVSEVVTPQGSLLLTQVRASLDVRPDGKTEGYVLAGELRTAAGERAREGERLVLAATGPAKVAPVLTWDDWTGGLATTDRSPAPTPYGVGTIGARPPGELGAARFPLAIRRMDVRVSVKGDFATTEVDQTFFNPRSQVVEGLYAFRAPRGATLQRFGVDRDGDVAWGRVQERAQARARYRSNVYAGSTEDPALLEWDAPGVYRARLYPIAPGDTRRVVVRYTEWLGRTGAAGERRLYVYPMAAEGTVESLPRIEELSIVLDLRDAGTSDVRTGMAGVRRGRQIVIRRQDFLPRADLAVELFDDGEQQVVGYRAKHQPDLDVLPSSERAGAKKAAAREADYLLVPVRAPNMPLAEGGLDLAIVVDASAATDEGSLAIARATTSALLSHLGADDRAVVWAGADRLRAVLPELTNLQRIDPKRRRELLTQLSHLERGGATDLGRMLGDAAAALDPKRRGAVIYVGDGAATVGELSLDGLRERLAKLPRPVRIFGIGIGAQAEMGVLAGIANAGFAERVGDGYAAARTALRVLEEAERPAWLGASVDLGPNVERVFPRNLNALVADESVLVVGRIVGKEKPRQIKLGGPNGITEHELNVARASDQGDLRRRWAGWRLDELLAEQAGRAAMVDVGVRHGIITPVTSLYVPTRRELEAEYGWDERERRQEAKPEQDSEAAPAASAAVDNREGGTGTRARGEEGAMGKATNRRYAVGRPRDNPDPHIARAAAREEAQEFGMIGLLNAGAAGDPNAPTAPWGRDTSARGNMWGDELEDAAGSVGLGAPLVDAEEEKAPSVPADSFGGSATSSLGHGAGVGTGQGFGSGHGRLGGSQHASAPLVRMGATSISGRLPPEVIQRIVRQNFGRFRMCYEVGLARNPNLEGRIATRFVIGRDGSVGQVANGGSDLPDSSVIQCVVGAFHGLSFPQPEGGVVTVVQPIMFSPGRGGATPVPVAPTQPVRNVIHVRTLPRQVVVCGAAARLPLAERVRLWRERLVAVRDNPMGAAETYRRVLQACEAPTRRTRARLASLMLDEMTSIRQQVTLWRFLREEYAVADVLYRGILSRVKTTADRRELHEVLGLESMDPGRLQKVWDQARTAEDRVAKLRALRVEWPDDFALALRLLDADEDAGDLVAARTLARQLRERSDVDASVRTAVGELYLRLAKRAGDPRQQAEDEASARRAFGEIVEFAPTDPVARRRLGDLLRSHGWFAEARRQYETLAQLVPDDATVPLLIAAAAQGTGRLEEAVRWTEKGGGAGTPDVSQGPAATARILATTYLAWGRLEARRAKRDKELETLVKRGRRVLKAGGSAAGQGVRVSLFWTHPDFHPTLWTNALGASMPAAAGDMTFGIAEAVVPPRADAIVEVRLEKDEVAQAARLGATAILTVTYSELGKDEKVIRIPVRFERDGPAVRSFRIANEEVIRG